MLAQEQQHIVSIALTHIHRHKKGQASHGKTRNPTTHHDLIPFMFGRDHDNVANAKDYAPEGDT